MQQSKAPGALLGGAAPSAASSSRNDTLLHVRDVKNALFLGRLPKSMDVHAVSALCANPAPGVQLRVHRVIPSRATYMFIEFDAPAQARQAADILNGFELAGSRIVALPATQLRRLFIGNIARDCPAVDIHAAIKGREPVRAPPRRGGGRARRAAATCGGRRLVRRSERWPPFIVFLSVCATLHALPPTFRPLPTSPSSLPSSPAEPRRRGAL